MKPSRIVLLLIAIIAGGLAAFLATRGSGPAPDVQQVVAQKAGPAAQVLVAKQAVGVGERLSAAVVEWQAWPESAVRPEYITIAKTPDAPAKISGTVARFEIFPGEPISDAKLAHSDQGFLSAVLDPGMRGVSVLVSAASGSGGFIIPNDRVDVLTTDKTQGQAASRVILSDVKVLAIGTRLGQTGTTGAPADPTDPKSQIFTNDSIATLELTPPQAETLITATANGKISLVLRSVADFAKPGPVANDSIAGSQTVRIIRFGRAANVTPGSADQPGSQATINPAAFTTPAPAPAAATPAAATTTTTTTTPAAATPSSAPTATTSPASTEPAPAPAN
jgi:pilus assembly protein CpaB